MSKTKRIAWMAVLLAATVWAAGANGSMIGIGREGDFALEIFAEPSEVVRGAGALTVALPREAERLCHAADVRTGDGVWMGTSSGAGKADATMVRLASGWRSCELKLKETVRSVPAPVERFHLAPWVELGNRFALQLDGLAQTNEAAWQDGLEDILARAETLFGGQSMVAGFPGTKYAAVYRKVKRSFDRCVRKGQMRGFGAARSLKSNYGVVFGEEWPVALPAVFFSGDDRPIDICRISGADGKPVPDIFDTPLPIRLEGTNHVESVLPAGTMLKIAYTAAEGGEIQAKSREQVFSWSTDGEGGCPVWFMLQTAAAGDGVVFSTNLLENTGPVAVSVKVNMDGNSRTCMLPVGARALLCLVIRPGIRLGVHVEPDASDPFAHDWTVTARKEADSVIRFDAVRKEPPQLVLNNPEMMPVDVTITPVGGGWGSTTKRTLPAGATGVGIAVPAHKPLVVSYRFRSDFHKAGMADVPSLFYGDRTNLVLRAELKGDPEVMVQNTGPVAVRLVGMSTPAEGVVIPPGKSAKVSIPAGKRVVLNGTAANSDYQCEPLSVGAMDSGEIVNAKLRLSLKPAPQIVLRNAGGMMDVEATPMSAAGRPIGKSVTIKRGTSTRPMPLSAAQPAYYRLSYSNGRFVSHGHLEIPVVPRGEIRTLDIPNHLDGIQIQTPDMPNPPVAPTTSRPTSNSTPASAASGSMPNAIRPKLEPVTGKPSKPVASQEERPVRW